MSEVSVIVTDDSPSRRSHEDLNYTTISRQNESSHNLSIDWKKRAVIEFYLQLKSVYTHKRLHNALTIPIIMLSTIAGASIFSSNNATLQYVAASFSISSALLTGLLRQLQPGEKAIEHLAAVRKWSRIINKFQLQEIKPSIEKADFLIKIEAEIESIFSSQPEPVPSAIEAMRKKYGNDTMNEIWFGKDIQTQFRNAKNIQKEKTVLVQIKEALKH